MILPGHSFVTRQIVNGLRSQTLQSQPCGMDLTLRRILTWSSHGSIDFDNSLRRTAQTREIPLEMIQDDHQSITSSDTDMFKSKSHAQNKRVHLPQGSYLVEFNETVAVPLDVMGQIFVRSSLFRSGALLSAGVMDSGYQGGIGALLQVVNPLGLQLYENARLAQLVFHQMSEPVMGYDGAYQGKTSFRD